jgi:hypothetical protein
MFKGCVVVIVLMVSILDMAFWGHDVASAAGALVTVRSGDVSVALDPVPVDFKYKGHGALGVLGGVVGGVTNVVPLAPVAAGVAGAVGAAASPPPKCEYHGLVAGVASDNRITPSDSISFDFRGTKDEMLQLQLARFGRKGNMRRVSIDRYSILNYIDPVARIEMDYAKTGDDTWHLTPKTALTPGQYGMFLRRLGPVADFEVVAPAEPKR